MDIATDETNTNTLCAMQERLNEDADGVYKQEMADFFKGWYDKLKTEVDKGLGPEDYGRYNELMIATGIAYAIVDVYWKNLHAPA